MDDATQHDDEPAPRWGGLPVVLGAVAAAVLLLELVLRLCLPAQPDALLVLERFARPARLQSGRRLAGALEQTAPENLAIVAGLSSVREGIDPAQLERVDPGTRRWLVLAMGGGMFRQIEHLLRPVIAYDVRPAAIVLGIHPEWLAELSHEYLVDLAAAWGAEGGASKHLWAIRNRNGMSLLGRAAMTRLRERVLPRLGVEPAAMYGRVDPWTSLVAEHAEQSSEGHRRLQLENWDKAGWFSVERYRVDSPEGRALDELLATLSQRTRVLVVLMPASAAWRERTPARAREVLMEVVARSVPPQDVLDLEDALDTVPDAMFDHSHANARGRALLTERIGTWVGERLR